jgi:tungstate transport system substrate-binding protein
MALVLCVTTASPGHAQTRFITLASTTSTEQSGLFGHLLPLFKRSAGLDVHVVAVGTGQAFAIGKRGDADALLVHDRAGEEKFVADGDGIDRRYVMFNEFVFVGPRADPAHIRD